MQLTQRCIPLGFFCIYNPQTFSPWLHSLLLNLPDISFVSIALIKILFKKPPEKKKDVISITFFNLN
ncbi:hypothetical protein VCHA51O444_10739 [Vibrio chagasii]|nr:hypothetical protein VCHA51O444_10739 [Vibrio chagasii]